MGQAKGSPKTIMLRGGAPSRSRHRERNAQDLAIFQRSTEAGFVQAGIGGRDRVCVIDLDRQIQINLPKVNHFSEFTLSNLSFGHYAAGIAKFRRTLRRGGPKWLVKEQNREREMNRRLLLGALAAAASTLCLVTTAVAQEYTFRLHHFLGAQAPAQTKMLEPWAKAVEENAGGRVKIEIYPAMTLGGRPPELVQQARDGIVDLIWTANGYTPGLFPRTEVMELPTVFRNDPAAANLALYDMFESDLKEEYTGLEVMFLHVHAGQAFHMRDRDVHSPADLSGTKLRIPTRTGAWLIEALGATPVAMPVPELPPALQKGVVDGALIPWEIIPPLKI